MRIELSLKEFVEICNSCSWDVIEKTPGKDIFGKTLGRNLLGKDDYAEGNKFFCDSLEKRGYNKQSTEYEFLSDKSVKAEVNPFEPFVNMDETCISKLILRQKWHVLISVLAYIDTHSCYREIEGKSDDFDIGKIKTIVLDFEKHRFEIYGENGNKGVKHPYSSVYMNKWIFELIAKDLILKGYCCHA